MSNKLGGIGIDLGTTYSSVGYYRNGKFEIIPNEEGNRKTPSYVAFTDRGRLIGDAAKRQANLNPKNTVFNIGRLIGRKFDDATVQADMKYIPCKIVNDDGKPKIQIEYKKEIKLFTPEEILSMILSKMKKIAETYLGGKVFEAVIAVPVYYNSLQQLAITDAGVIAGLNVLIIINGSTLASIAYGIEKKVSGERNVLTFDLGGGILNVSVLQIEQGIFEVKSTAGNTHLGGEDFDNRLVQHFAQEFERKYSKDLFQNKRALQRLRTACENAKRILSSSMKAPIEIESLHEGIDFFSYITRTRFEELCADLFRSILKTLEKALRDAKMDKASIHEIVLVGGSTRIPKIQKLLQDFFNGKELNKSINPDEAIAYGAAIQVAIFTDDKSEELKDTLLLNVLPFSLGIDTADGVMTPIIKRNTTLPTTQIYSCTTVVDKQPSLHIKVFEGEREMTKDNHLLGIFEFSGIPSAPRGVPKIEFIFDIDIYSGLHLSAIDKTSGIKKKLTITNDKNYLSKDEIERMIFEAEKFEKDDEMQCECDTVKQSLESYCINTEATINDKKLAHKINTNERKRIMENIEETLEWLETNQYAEKDEYEYKLQAINNICNPFLTKLTNEVSDIPDDTYVDMDIGQILL